MLTAAQIKDKNRSFNFSMATPEKRMTAAELKREQEGVLDDNSSIFISVLTRVRLHSETT